MNVNASSDPEADPINVGLALALAQARQIPGTWTIEPTPFVAINYDKSLPKCIAKAGLLEVSGITDLSFMSEAYKGAEAAGFALDALGPALGRAWARSEFGVNTRSSRPLTQIAHASRGGILAIGTALSTQSGIGDVLQSLIPFRGTKNAYDSMMPSCGYGRTGDE